MDTEKAVQPDGTVIYGDPSVATVTVERVGNVLLTQDYWMCDVCKCEFITRHSERCENCGNARDDAPDAFVVEIVRELPENISMIEIYLYRVALDDFFSENSMMARPGFIARLKATLRDDEQGMLEYMMERSTRKNRFKPKEFMWPSRQEVINYLREYEHLAWDDIERMFWFDKHECCKRNLRTGKLIQS